MRLRTATAKALLSAPSVRSRERNFLASFALFISLLALSGCSQEGKYKELPIFYDLVENFALADVQQESTLIDIGTPTARKHLLTGWYRNETWPRFDRGADMTMVWGVDEKSVFKFFLSEAREIQLTLRCFPFRFPDAPTQTITVYINGNEVEQITLNPNLNEYHIVLPRQAVKRGTNHLKFRYAYSRAPADVQWPPDSPSAKDRRSVKLAVGFDYIRFGAEDTQPSSEPRADPESGVLYIPFGTQVDYYLRLPAGSAVTFESLSLKGSSAGQLHLILQQEGQEEGILESLQAPEEFRAILLPLDDPEIVRVSFYATASAPASIGQEGVTLVGPAIRTKHVEEKTQSQTSPRLPQLADGSKRPNVIIYLIDALRADHLGCYGYKKPISPNIDAFASKAILFENALAQSSWTRMSVASIFTGLTPGLHGIDNLIDALPPAATTLAEVLRNAGYHTAAFTTNIMASERFGLDQGFDEFVTLSDESSDRVNEAVFSWLRKEATHERPFFLYVHTLDPHAPYTPPFNFRKRFAAGVSDDRIGTTHHMSALRQGNIPVTESLIGDLLSLYDAEIAFNDDSFGLFLEELKHMNLYEEALIIFLADHGEEFYEHGEWEHSPILHRKALHIPLIVKLASNHNDGGKKVPHLAQQIDILPTILDYVGLGIPKEVEGRSLLRTISSTTEEREPRTAFSYAWIEWDALERVSVEEGRWKLIRHGRLDTPEHNLELYDLQQDPGEFVDLIDKHPVIAGYMVSLLKSHEGRRSALKPAKAVIDEELREKLRGLGYVQ